MALSALTLKGWCPYIRRCDLERENVDAAWLEVCFKCTRSFLVAIVYRPLASSKHLSDVFKSSFESVVAELTSKNKEMINTVHMNCDYLKPNKGSRRP